ncbi:Cytosolic carboxypeptidase 1 [Fasciolopsis buskii]|uniref:Cytosolic carboxypeptidase 1 n=1 Tax=Fasciolopsis buskii TaxID=27845 RepID=A0A8E0RM49_9TREM|nr:Cytosolic carboxypeptidase 1 [Fasciolopsis buski]
MLSAPPALIAAGVCYHSTLLRLALNTLHCLIRWKHNATRAINSGAIGILLDLFLDVHRCDLRGRRIPLQRSALACLKCLTVSRESFPQPVNPIFSISNNFH